MILLDIMKIYIMIHYMRSQNHNFMYLFNACKLFLNAGMIFFMTIIMVLAKNLYLSTVVLQEIFTFYIGGMLK